MKISRDEFKSLQQTWYERLKENGFEDIERFQGNQWVLTRPVPQCRIYEDDTVDILQRIREEYFEVLSNAVFDENTIFANEIDKYILTRYSEGARIESIRQELKAQGAPRARDSIRYIIRRYEMAWNIKSYEPQELHKKRKKK